MTTPAAQQAREVVRSFFPPNARAQNSVATLASLLENFIHNPDLATRLNAFIELREWTAVRAPSPLGGSITRLETLLAILESRSELRAGFQQAVREILNELRSVELFAEAGLHPRESLWSQAARRFIEEVLPSARKDTDLSKFAFRLYPTSKAIEQLVALPDVTFERMARVLSPVSDAGAWAKQREDLTQAFSLLAVHIAGIGLWPGLRARCHAGLIEESPFCQLQQTTVELVRQEGDATVLERWRTHVKRCREEVEYVHQHMEESGVSTALVFDLGTIERAITRMETIAEVLFIAQRHQSIAAVKRLLDDVMNARRGDMSVRALFRENAALLARKVVERTGKAGEHYIANSSREYRTIWKASLGGGLLTVLTAAIKLRIGEAHLPPFVDGIAAGTNYAVSFLVLQHFHLALATKQPSVTAATFAGIVRTTGGRERLEKLTEFISRITRSQLASAAGNLLAVCLGGVAFAKLWALLFQRAYLATPSAEYVYKTLNPLASGTMIYATLTGLILWVSALAGGWFENFATFNRVPEAIAQHPLGRKLGHARMQKLAATVDANLSGWTTSIVLGYLLGFVPAVGRFFGIPLDVRHVTLSTGTLTLAAASLGRDWLYRGWFVYTVLGIAVTFALNLGVSFSVAAEVALKAHGVSRNELFELMRYTAASFLRSPRRFLLPSGKMRGPAPTEGRAHRESPPEGRSEIAEVGEDHRLSQLPHDAREPDAANGSAH
jgi:site-specific recombinase